MDAVRFGRALGFGTRQAAKTVISAVDAARAESPSKPAAAAHAAPPAAVRVASTLPMEPRRELDGAPKPEVHRAAPTAARTVAQARGMQEGFSRFKASAVEPVVRLSGVLWLEVAGVFFGIFALSTAIAVWRLRAEWRSALTHPASHGSLLAAGTVFALFTYFCISSFVRARRRERQRG